jgi:putative SOS response-associated peptidase YedK
MEEIGTSKQPYAIALADGRLMALAGLWENWRSPAGEWVRSFAIIPTTPNELRARLLGQKVMPVMRKIGKELGLTGPFVANAPLHLRYSTDLKQLPQAAEWSRLASLAQTMWVPAKSWPSPGPL